MDFSEYIPTDSSWVDEAIAHYGFDLFHAYAESVYRRLEKIPAGSGLNIERNVCLQELALFIRITHFYSQRHKHYRFKKRYTVIFHKNTELEMIKQQEKEQANELSSAMFSAIEKVCRVTPEQLKGDSKEPRVHWMRRYICLRLYEKKVPRKLIGETINRHFATVDMILKGIPKYSKQEVTFRHIDAIVNNEENHYRHLFAHRRHKINRLRSIAEDNNMRSLPTMSVTDFEQAIREQNNRAIREEKRNLPTHKCKPYFTYNHV